MTSDTDLTRTATYGGPAPDLLGILSRGDCLGRYVVLEEIGAGGMGVVYAAYDPELDRQVALKVLPASSQRDSEEARLRLIREAQALARVVHPNVVAVHDVGSLDRQVFLAMELVKGVDLAAWLVESPRDWREIVGVFVEAGRGLAAVHDAGLAHRDFKPSNVRVGEDGRVRVLDFGLAQGAQVTAGATLGATLDDPSSSPLEPQESSLLHQRLTQEGRVFGTPRYMAPEQHLGRRADARSDQFAFCVALWEALYGEHPVASAAESDLLEVIRRGPSAQLQNDQRIPTGIHQSLVRGLRAEPDDRFASMGELLDTLARHTESRRKWLWPAVAASLAAVILIYGLFREPACSSGAGKLVGIWDESLRSEIQQVFREQTFKKHDSIWRATQANLDTFTDQWRELYTEVCEATHVRKEQSSELLDLRMACLEERRQELGALVGLFAEADAELVARAEQASTSLSSLAACSDIRRLTLPKRIDDPRLKQDVAKIRGRLAEARALRAAGRHEQHLAVAEQAMGDARRLGYSPLTAEVSLELGASHYRASRPGQAKSAYLDARHFADAGRHDVVRAEALHGLLWLAGDGQIDADETQLRQQEARAVIQRLDDDPQLLIRWQQAAARILRAEGRLKEAAEAVASAIELSERLYGRDHPDTASMVTTLGTIQAQEGRFQPAIASFQRALQARQAHLRPDHPDIGSVQQQLANILLQLGSYEQAADYLTSSLHIAGDQRTVHRARVLADLGYAEVRLGRDQAGIDHMLQSLELCTELRGDGSPKVAEILNYLGDSYLEMGDPAAAELCLRRALAIYDQLGRRALPPALNSARALIGLGRIPEATEQIAELRRLMDPDHYLSVWVELAEGELFAASGEKSLAVARFEHVKEVWQSSDQASPLDLAMVSRRLAEAGDDLDPTVARAHAEQALSLYRAQGAAGTRGAKAVETWLAARAGSRPSSEPSERPIHD